MVNDRPISVVAVDSSEPKALSPADLLYGYPSRQGLPDTKKILKAVENASALVFSERFRMQQTVLRSFWKKYQNLYLQQLRSAHFRKPQDSRPIKEGDVYILHSADASRAFWPLCKVLQVFGGEGTDARRRSCLIKTNSGQTLRRPLQLLYPLEVESF